jgi:uncharacterized protein
VDWVLVLALAVVGLLAGIVSSLFGIGGGLVMVPVLHYLGHVPFHHATALSLLVISVQSPFGVWQHARRAAVHYSLAWPLVVAGAAGVAIGVQVEPYAPVPWLKVLLSLLMLLAAWRLVGHLPVGDPDKSPGLPFLLGLGLVAGFVSKLLGIGGGLLTVPVLAMVGVPVHLAVGSSLVPVFSNAAFATAEALAQGFDWRPAVPMALGALCGVPLGARAAHALDAKGLSRVFAVGLVLAALYIGLTSGVL